MPDQYRDRQDFIEQIISLIAAWPLEFAAVSVRSNPDIIRMGVEADKRNGYGPSALKYVDDFVLQNLDFLTEILAMQPTDYFNLPDTLKENRQLIRVVLKSGLWVTDDIGSDPELLTLFASSSSRNMYFHIPSAAQNDPNLTRLYIENGGEWTALPESLKDNIRLFDCYLSLFPFGTDAAENQMFELTRALKHLFKIESWANCPLDPDLVAHCLSINLGVAGTLRYSIDMTCSQRFVLRSVKHPTQALPEDWRESQQTPIQAYFLLHYDWPSVDNQSHRQLIQITLTNLKVAFLCAKRQRGAINKR